MSDYAQILAKGVDAWNRWRNNLDPKGHLDMRSFDFRPYLHLDGIDLSSFDIDEEYFSIDLTGTRFQGVTLRDANFCGNHLDDADFSNADLRNVSMGFFPHGDDFMETQGRNTCFHGANMRYASIHRACFCDSDFRKTHLEWSDLDSSSFAQCEFSGSHLDHASLSGAHLAHCTFHGASLIGAMICNASLKDTDLSRSDLSRANLSGAELKNVSLAHANLRGANLTSCRLDAVDFRGAILKETVLSNVLLSCCVNLDTCTHAGPSTVDLRTLQRTGTLPIPFLQGCGLSESLISYLPSLQENAIDFYSCFISYSHEDKSFAHRLHNQLQARGIRCWLDEHEILPGDDIYKSVNQGIRLWDKVLLCASENSLNSWWVNDEIDTAVEKERQLQEKGKGELALIPLNLDGHLFKWDGAHAAKLRKRLAADFTGWKLNNTKFEEQVERVVKALKTERVRPPERKM